jgi:hypothetical protein
MAAKATDNALLEYMQDGNKKAGSDYAALLTRKPQAVLYWANCAADDTTPAEGKV